MQTNSGEFDTQKKLRDMLTLLCLSNSTYEVVIRSHNDEDGVIYCDKGTIRNAACFNLSGMEALIEILSWQRGTYWVEELPIIPKGTMDIPLSELWLEIDKRMSRPLAQMDSEPSSDNTGDAEPVFVPASRPNPGISDGQPGETDLHPPDVADQGEADESRPETSNSEESDSADIISAEPGSEASFSAGANPALKGPGEQLLEKILSIKGVEGIILTSVDGEVLAVEGRQAKTGQTEMIALLGEALSEIGESFGKGTLSHGAIDFATYRVLIHTLEKSFVGTVIGNGVSAAVTGAEIERLIEGHEAQ